MVSLRILLPLAAGLLLLASAHSALTAANVVPETHVADSSRSIGANDVKPEECASLDLASRSSGSGSVSGTDGNDLLAGGAGIDAVAGGLGDDCILGGDGDDDIDGGPGTDICIGGPGTDSFLDCETTIQ